MDSRLVLAMEGLFALGALLMAASHRVSPGIRTRCGRDWVKFAIYFALLHAFLLSALAGRAWTALLLAGVSAAGAVELRAQKHALPRILRAVPILAPILLAVLLGHALFGGASQWFGSFAFLLLLVAATDSFAQLSGRLWGRLHPFRYLSPAKTLEGLIGGWTAALGVSLLCGFLAPGFSAMQRALLGLATALAATGGDLLFSAVKRRAHIKDFSGILPGHGGILDRFDSLVLAAPVYYWARVLILNAPPA